MKKVVLVTGSAKGIGAAIIKELASCGYNCVINYNTSYQEAMDLKKYIEEKYNSECLAIKADITSEQEVDEMLSIISNKFDGVDILINNASVDLSCLFDEKTIENFKYTLDVNLVAAYAISKKVFKHMKDKKWGRIINITSTNGINTYYPMCLEYDASKAALISLTHNLSIQFAPFVTVNAIAPGLIGTEAELEGYDEEFLAAELEKILIRRYGKPEEVAHLVKFLVSDEASYINNSVIRIDGGQYGSN